MAEADGGHHGGGRSTAADIMEVITGDIVADTGIMVDMEKVITAAMEHGGYNRGGYGRGGYGRGYGGYGGWGAGRGLGFGYPGWWAWGASAALLGGLWYYGGYTIDDWQGLAAQDDQTNNYYTTVVQPAYEQYQADPSSVPVRNDVMKGKEGLNMKVMVQNNRIIIIVQIAILLQMYIISIAPMSKWVIAAIAIEIAIVKIKIPFVGMMILPMNGHAMALPIKAK